MEAKQGPFQKQSSATLQAFWVTAIFTASLESEFWARAKCFGCVCADLKILGKKSSTRKQFSFPRFLSISVNRHHVCDWCAKLFYIWGCRLYFNILFNLAFRPLSSALFYCQIADLSTLCCRDKLWPPWKLHQLGKGKLDLRPGLESCNKGKPKWGLYWKKALSTG